MSTENESIQETYDWAKKQRSEWDGMVAEKHPMVTRLDVELTNGGDHPVASISFAKFESDSFSGEVGKNDDGDLIFHFWPSNNDRYNVLELLEVKKNDDGSKENVYIWRFGETFKDILADAFIKVFRFEEKLCWDFVPEMNSWVVRAQGFGKNLMADELATKLFHDLKERLES